MKNEKRKIVKPVRFVAKQSLGTGRQDAIAPISQEIVIDDPRLVDIVESIPPMCDGVAYLKGISDILDAAQTVECTYVSEPLKTENGIVRSQNRQVLASVELANFTVVPLRRKIFLRRDGSAISEKEVVLAEVRFQNGQNECLEISVAKIDDLCKIVTRRFSYAIVNFSEANVEKSIVAEFRLRTTNLPVEIVLCEAGWQSVQGQPTYVHDMMPEKEGMLVQTGLDLPFYRGWKPHDAGNVLLQALKITEDKEANTVMILFSLLGVLFKPFELAGYKVRFLLFINGASGTLKTSIAKVLFSQLSSARNREVPRRIDSDTITSLERALVESGYDTTLLFDDYAPAKTSGKKTEMINKLEALIRMIGDSATKSRSNATLKDKQGEGVGGVAVVTGEIRGGGNSSVLRCVYCKLNRGKVNLQLLEDFQKNRYAYTTMITHFVEFVSMNWTVLIDLIRMEMPEERLRLQAFIKERRLVDSAAILSVTAEIVKKFLVEYCGYEMFLLEKTFEEMHAAVDRCLIQNEAMLKMERYSQSFLRALNALMEVNRINLHQGKVSQENVKVYDGYEDSDYFYFLPEITYTKAVGFLSQMGDYIPFDLHEMVEMLFEDGIIKKYANGLNKHTYYARVDIGNGHKQRFLKISKKVFRDYVDRDFVES